MMGKRVRSSGDGGTTEKRRKIKEAGREKEKGTGNLSSCLGFATRYIPDALCA